MFTQAVYATGEGRCQRGDWNELAAAWRAMKAGRGGASGGPRRHRHRGFWPGPEGDFPFGGFPHGAGPRGRGRKARRGDIRTAALLLLAEEPRNGYQIMQEVEERSEGVWRPSPGSVYPALAQLEDEGLIRSEEADGRKLFVLTDAGAAYLKERGEDKPAPWVQMTDDVSDGVHDLRKLVRDVAFAFAQVVRTGSAAQMTRAREVLTGARRDLYRILADGEEEGPAEPEAKGAGTEA